MEKKQYECTVLLDASNGQTVFANSPEEAAELAQDAAMEDGAGSLCHYCSRHTDTGDIYGVVVYEGDNEVLNTTYHAEREKSLQGKIDALQLRLNAVEEENDRLRNQTFEQRHDKSNSLQGNPVAWLMDPGDGWEKWVSLRPDSSQDPKPLYLNSDKEYLNLLIEQKDSFQRIGIRTLERLRECQLLLKQAISSNGLTQKWHDDVKELLARADISSGSDPSDDHSVDAGKIVEDYEIAGYEGSSGLYYSRLAAVANGEQSVEPVYRVKK